MTNIPEALYKLGETVILSSSKHPQFNGEYTVEKIIYIPKYNAKGQKSHSYGWYYYLGFNPYKNDDSEYWSQSSLKKKYLPSTESFKKIMSDINSR